MFTRLHQNKDWNR